MVQDFDPLEPEERDQPREGSLLDLPLGGGAPAGEEVPPPPRPSPRAAKPPPAGPVWEPRHRRSRGRAFWLLPLLLAAAAVAAFLLWPRGAPARLAASAEAVEFGPRRIGSPAEPLELRLSNSGERLLRFRGIELAGDGAARFNVAVDECSGARLVAGQECRLAVEYRPEAAGEHAALLRVRARAADGALELPVSGRGVAPRIQLEPASVRFDPLPVGGRGAASTVRLANAGDAGLSVHGVGLEGGGAADFATESDRCSSTELAPGESCTLKLLFLPRVEGARRAVLRVRTDALGGGDTVPLEGEGLAAPEIALVPARLDFGNQLVGSQAAARQLVLTNRGGAAVDLGPARLEGQEFRASGDRCSGRSLAAGQQCSVEVVFRPSAEGEVRRKLELAQSGRTGLAWSVELLGRGVAPRLSWSASRLDWGEVPIATAGAAKALRLENSGSGELRLDGVRLAGADRAAFAVRGEGCSGARLAPGAGCEVEVLFSPGRLAGYRAEIEALGPSLGGPKSVELHGNGVGGRLAVDSDRLEFGSVRVSESATRSITLRNTGSAPLTLVGVTVRGRAGADFATGGDCRPGAPLAVDEACRLVVRFAPASEGGRVAEIVIRHDGEDDEATIALSGAASAPPVGELRLSERRLDFDTVRAGERSSIVSLTLSNAGPGPVSLGGFSIDGPQAAEFRIVPGSCEGISFLSPGGVCGVGFRFQPAAAGDRRARLVVRHNAPGGALTVTLAGTAYE